MGLTVAGVLLNAADSLAADAPHRSPAVAVVEVGAATVLRIVAQLVDGMDEGDAVKTLEAIRDGGTTPITQAVKDAQAQTAVDAAFGGDPGPAALAGLRP